MPNNNLSSGSILKGQNSLIFPANPIYLPFTIGPSLCEEKSMEETNEDSYTLLPSCGFSDRLIEKSIHTFLEKLIRGQITELNYKKTDTVEDIFKKLNRRIARCRNFKEESLELSKNLVNNYVIIRKSKNKSSSADFLDDIEESNLDCELNESVRKSLKVSEDISLGYIYRVVLDIRNESSFHVYLRPSIYTDTLGRSANLMEEEIRTVSFEELSTLYKIITKDEYERKVKELFIKDIENND